MDISIIICTRNRAESLAQTLDSFKSVEVPHGATAEILVVDNASTDQTREVTQKQKLPHLPVRYLLEQRPGKMWAQNLGVAEAQGTVILTTDDDVRPAQDWLEKISRPLLTRECDATVGRVLLSDELRRPWMTEDYRSCVAWYDGPPKQALDLIGANMGFHRSVLEHIPAFDTETGPGALGFCDDTLFGLQLEEAGFRLRFVPEAWVIHYADPSRLLRRHCLNNSERFGASLAYILHHWRHEKLTAPRLRYYYLGFKLMVRRLMEPPPAQDAEGTPSWEASYIAGMAQCRQFLLERRRPRNYAKRGLTKQVAHAPSA